MSQENTKRSILIFVIALSTPLLVWFVLRLVANSTPPAFDPNPRIQSFVEKPEAITADSPKTRWIHVISDNRELFIESKNGRVPLSEFKENAEFFVILTDIKGSGVAPKYFDFLKTRDLTKRSITLSASDGFLADMRRADSNLTLGTGQAYIVRRQALERLGLHNIMTVNMSGVWLEPKNFAAALESLTLHYVQLRVPVFIGPVSADEAKLLPAGANSLIY